VSIEPAYETDSVFVPKAVASATHASEIRSRPTWRTPSIAITGCGAPLYTFTSTLFPNFLSFSPYATPSSLSTSSSHTAIHALGLSSNPTSGAKIGDASHSARVDASGRYIPWNHTILAGVSDGVCAFSSQDA